MRKHKLLILALVVLLGAGLSFTPSGGGADQVNFPLIYIDADAGNGGAGSLADPYNNLSDINWTTGGDNSIFDYLAGSPSESPQVLHQSGDEWTAEKMSVGCSGTATYPIIVGKYGGGADPIIDNEADVTGWDTSGNWTATFGSNIVTDGGFAATTDGAEMLSNIDMELDDYWDNDFGTPTTNEQSTDQKHGGSNSWKIVSDANGEGCKSDDDLDPSIGICYKINGWWYPDGTSTTAMFKGETGAPEWSNWTAVLVYSGTVDQWNEKTIYANSLIGGTGFHLALAEDISGDTGTHYFDDMSLEPVTFDSWQAGTGWGVEAATSPPYALTNKANKIAGTASNLEQSGLTATASAVYQITYTISNRTAGAVYVEFGSTNGTSRSTDDTFVEEITATDTDYLKFVADNAFDGTIDTVVVQLQGAGWYIGSIDVDPHRVWLDGTEYYEAQNEADIDSTYRWWWDDPNNRLYVYCAANPADTYSTMRLSHVSTATNSAINITNYSYITVNDLDLRGGMMPIYVQATSATVTGIIIDGCTIGYNAGEYGIQIQSWHDDYDVTYGEIKNCTIDSNFHLNSQDYNSADGNKLGINLNTGAQYWDIHDNTLTDWAHNAIKFNGTTNRINQYNEFYLNTVQCPDAGDGKVFAFGSQAAGTCINNKFYRNYITGQQTKSNMGGSYNEVYYNIWNAMTRPSSYAGNYGYAIHLTKLTSESHHNKIYNNVFYDIDEAAIKVDDNADVANNEITNNIFMNCGLDAADSGFDDRAIIVGDAAGGNTYNNNSFYKSGVTDYVSYRSTDRTVAEFNGETGNNSDVMTDNQGGDPLMTDPANDDFTLNPHSPCVNKGTDVSLTEDYLGLKIRHAPDIGAYENQTNVIFFPIPGVEEMVANFLRLTTIGGLT